MEYMINFIGGEKGGVGQSVVSRLLAQYFIDNNIPFKGYDTDRSHQTFLRFYGDLAAQTNLPLLNWIEESNVIELCKELNVKIKFWHVMDDSKDSVFILDTLLKTFQDKVDYVIVFNRGRGSQFSIFESSATKNLAIQYNASFLGLDY